MSMMKTETIRYPSAESKMSKVWTIIVRASSAATMRMMRAISLSSLVSWHKRWPISGIYQSIGDLRVLMVEISRRLKNTASTLFKNKLTKNKNLISCLLYAASTT